MKKIKRIMLLQPNFSILGKRTWRLIPYNLGIIASIIAEKFEVQIYDPNFSDDSGSEIIRRIGDFNPDLIGITSFSTEYLEEINHTISEIKQNFPHVIIVFGGIIPTVMPDSVIENNLIDFAVAGEGEHAFLRLIGSLNENPDDVKSIPGIVFKKKGHDAVINHPVFIQDLDAIPFPNYVGLDAQSYFNSKFKHAPGITPRQFPFTTTITSRGCPFKCIFCAASTVSGRKVRMRSARNVLEEIDFLVDKYSIKEIIFLDDHFLFSKSRSTEIINGIIDRRYGLTWKCANLAVFSTDEYMLELMMKSGCYQLTFSIESGNQYVVNKLIKKPVNLSKAKNIINVAKRMGFEIIANFIIGTPGETFDQIRESLAYAESLDSDIVNIHIATPLPKTELMEICQKSNLLIGGDRSSGYTSGQIQTDEFTSSELNVLRAFEWDRINFKNEGKINKIAAMNNLSSDEVKAWRKSTRMHLGKTIDWKSRFDNPNK